ncbi:CopD family protein [Bordetella bronchialis]|nr:CopD family protein [Bordetella bronchialis]
MMEFAVLYTWLKVLHVAAALTFVIGVSALSLVLVADAPDASQGKVAAARMRRWYRAVTTPAMLLTWALGIALAVRGHWMAGGWLHAKVACVVLLSAIHGVQAGTLRRRAQGQPAGVWRLTPLIVATATLAILALALAKPF